ncbi:MAG TPA: tetratricopeptide repeat protein, partial [Candidatus Limnocylindrales bacterium]|nr:tetratricopeptide repeat protein [Candidatus Limnocylindrales bacterium]
RAVAATDADPTARIAALTGLALAEAAAGDVDAGVAHGLAAVELCRQIGDRHLEGAVENHLADLLHAAGRDDDAMTHLRRAVEAFAEVGGDAADQDPGIWMLSAF